MDQFPLVLIAVIIVLIWLFNSLNVLREYERGVIFRVGRLMGEPKGPGLIWVIWPIDRIVRVSLRTITMDVPTQDFERHLIAGAAREEAECKERQAVHRRAVEGEDDVARPQAGLVGRTAGNDVRDDHAGIAAQVEAAGQVGSDRLHVHPDFAPVQPSVAGASADTRR